MVRGGHGERGLAPSIQRRVLPLQSRGMLVPYGVAVFYTMHGKQGGTTDLFYLPLHRRNSVQGQFCFSTLRGEGNMKIDLMKERWQA